MGYINVRDIQSLDKRNDVRLQVQDHGFDFFGVGETWLHSEVQNDKVLIPDYQLLRQDRPNITKINRGGGVCLYIKDNWDFVLKPSPFPPCIDAIHIEASRPKVKPLSILMVYSPKEHSIKCRQSLNNFLENAPINTYIIGDINIDMLSYSSDSTNLRSILIQNNFYQLVKSHTRITENSQTLIDVIITNCAKMNSQTEVISNGIADHGLIYTIRKKCKSDTIIDQKKVLKLRSFTDIDSEALNTKIESAPWWIFEFNKNVNKTFEFIASTIQLVQNQFAPQKTVRAKTRRPKWFTNHYRKLAAARDNAKKFFDKNRTSYNKKEYQVIINKCNYLMQQLKAKEIENFAQNSDNPSKYYWKLFNEEAGRNQKTNNKISKININDTILTDPEAIADELCKSFTSLRRKDLEIPTGFLNNYTPAPGEPFCDIQLSEAEVLRGLETLDTTKGPGYDEIHPIFLKKAAISLCPILTYGFNLSLRTGTFPESLKKALIIPLDAGKGDKSSPSNYRPISLLPTISKIFEKLIFKRLSRVIEKRGLISESQHGFRKKFSTETAAIFLSSYCYSSIDDKKYVGLLFVDYRCAFDMVDSRVLIHKLRKMNIRGNILKWIQTYLTGRSMQVKANGQISSPQPLEVGNPQGSSLSSLLFSIYIDDLPTFLNKCTTYLYADDAVLCFSSNDPSEIEHVLNSELRQVNEWARVNGMELNTNKTKSMIISSPYAKKIDPIQIKLDGEIVESVKQFCYLGLELDPHLSWDLHFDKVLSKVKSRINMISVSKRYFSQEKLNIFCKSLILSVIDYGIVIWGGIAPSKIVKLDKLTIRMIQNILGNKQTNQSDLLESSNMMLTNERRNLYALKNIYKHVFMPGPTHRMFNELCKLKDTSKTNLNLRNSKNFVIPNLKTGFAKKAFYSWATKEWNSTPATIRDQPSLAAFDINYRQHILIKRSDIYMYN